MSLLAGFFRGHGSQLGKSVHAAGFFAVQVVLGVEPFHLTGEVSIESFGVEGRDGVNARVSSHQIVPGGGHVKTQGAYDAEAGNKYTAKFVHFNPGR